MQNRHGICLVKYVSYFQNRQRFRTSTALEDHVLLDVKRAFIFNAAILDELFDRVGATSSF